MPMDQHLTLNGVPLSNNDATLITLGIKPGSLLLLQVCRKLTSRVTLLLRRTRQLVVSWCYRKIGRKKAEFTLIEITNSVDLDRRLFLMSVDKIYILLKLIFSVNLCCRLMNPREPSHRTLSRVCKFPLLSNLILPRDINLLVTKRVRAVLGNIGPRTGRAPRNPYRSDLGVWHLILRVLIVAIFSTIWGKKAARKEILPKSSLHLAKLYISTCSFTNSFSKTAN